MIQYKHTAVLGRKRHMHVPASRLPSARLWAFFTLWGGSNIQTAMQISHFLNSPVNSPQYGQRKCPTFPWMQGARTFNMKPAIPKLIVVTVPFFCASLTFPEHHHLQTHQLACDPRWWHLEELERWCSRGHPAMPLRVFYSAPRCHRAQFGNHCSKQMPLWHHRVNWMFKSLFEIPVPEWILESMNQIFLIKRFKNCVYDEHTKVNTHLVGFFVNFSTSSRALLFLFFALGTFIVTIEESPWCFTSILLGCRGVKWISISGFGKRLVWSLSADTSQESRMVSDCSWIQNEWREERMTFIWIEQNYRNTPTSTKLLLPKHLQLGKQNKWKNRHILKPNQFPQKSCCRFPDNCCRQKSRLEQQVRLPRTEKNRLCNSPS